MARKTKEVDVVVVGAGNGGMGAALEASSKGMKTLLIDRHNIPGGAASSFVRGRFEFECSLHEAAQVGKKGNRDLYGQYLDDYGVDIDWFYEDYTYRYISPTEGVDVLMPIGVEPFIAKMEETVPGSRKSMEEFFEIAENAFEGFMYMAKNAPEPYFEGTASERQDKIRNNLQLTKLKGVLAAKYMNTLRSGSVTIKEALDMIGVPDEAQHILYLYWCYLGAPPSEMDFMSFIIVLMAYIKHGAAFPHMNSHEISLACTDRIYKNGGEIWYDTEVKEMIMQGDKVVGVRTDNWDVYAKEVIANINPHIVLGTMMNQENVAKPVQRYYSHRRTAVKLQTMYVGLDCSAEELGLSTYSNFIVQIPDGDELYSKMRGTYNTDFLIVNCLNTLVPDASPEGTCTLFFTGGSYEEDPFDKVKPEDYYKLKRQYAKDMIEIAEENLHIDIKSHVEELEVALAPTFARYMGTPNGTPYGFAMKTNDGIMMRAMNEIENHQIPGLHFCGAATTLTDGYSTSFISGAMSADYAVRKINAEKTKKRSLGR